MEAQITTTATSSLKAGRREWMALFVLALPTFLISMDSTVTFLALPSLSAALNPGSSQLLWITDIYSFLEGGFLIVMGVLGDRVGRRRLLIIGAVLFAIASVIAAFANTTNVLIMARAFLGMVGAIILPCTLSLIRSLFHDGRQRSVAFGIYTTCFSAGTMLGPLLGGMLLVHFWWGSVFLMNVPVMILFLFASILLPEYSDPQAKKFDLMSASLLTFSILSIIYGIKKIAEHGAVESLSVLSVMVGLIVGAAFLYRQKVIPNPLVDMRLFKIRVFSATLALLFTALFCWSGIYLFATQYLQLVAGLDPLKAGLLTIPPASLSMIGCMFAPQALRWFSRTSVIAFGMVIMLTGMLLLTLLTTSVAVFVLIVSCTLLSSGCGVIVTLGIELIVSTAPHEQAGAASGISESSTTFGSAFGIALLGSIGTAAFRINMSEINTHVNGTLLKAQSTLSEVVSTSHQLSTKVGTELLEQARMAFVSSFQLVGIAAAFLALLVLGAFWIIVRK